MGHYGYEIVCRYGVPVVIHNDQGANLTSSVIQRLCLLLGMERTRTTAYHPQENGQVERFNRTLEAMLAKVVQSNQRDWDTHLPKVLFAYHTAIHESTQFTPYHLPFGRSPMLPVDVMLGRQPSKLVEEGDVVKLPQFVEETHQYFNDAYDTVRSNLKQAHQRQKLVFDKKEHGENFQVGDRVWLYTPAVKRRSQQETGYPMAWFLYYWSRPALSTTVSNLLEPHTKVVHRNRLKPVFRTPELASRGSKPLHATPSRTFPAPNCGCPTYADVVKGSISSSELSAGSTTACEETASPLT